MFTYIMGRHFSAEQMDDFSTGKKSKVKHKVKTTAVTKFLKDKQDIQNGKLRSPSQDFQFIWDKDTGQRFLFRGEVDPVN